MSKKEAPKKVYYKANITMDVEEKKSKVSFTPAFDVAKPDNVTTHLNNFITGMGIGFNILLGALPVLRPATQEEADAKIYIFKDVDKDNALYQSRKRLYNTVANSFNAVLRQCFPDIDFINQSIAHQQEKVHNMTKEELNNHQEFVKILADKIRNEEKTGGDNDGDA